MGFSLIDFDPPSVGVTIARPSGTALDSEGALAVLSMRGFGIDQFGTPYFDPAGVPPGDQATLGYDPAGRRLFLKGPDMSQQRIDIQTLSDLGAALSLGAQLSDYEVLQSAATVNGDGSLVSIAGYNGAQMVEVVEAGGGTCTLTLSGSNDGGTRWYQIGYQRVDGVQAPTRAASGISVAANTAHVYQLLDAYQELKATISAASGTLALTATAYLVPA